MQFRLALQQLWEARIEPFEANPCADTTWSIENRRFKRIDEVRQAVARLFPIEAGQKCPFSGLSEPIGSIGVFGRTGTVVGLAAIGDSPVQNALRIETSVNRQA